MSDCVKITLVANAGVLVEHNGVGLLIDGIHHETGHPFSKVSTKDLLAIEQRAGIFTNLEYLLFTHEHPDHFTPQIVANHLQFKTVKGLFLPPAKNDSSYLASLFKQLRDNEIPHWTLGLAPGKMRRFALADNLIITAIGARHMGPQYATIHNDCFLLTLSDRNLLFTGDADHVLEYFENSLREVTLDAVFVNPIFYNNRAGQKIINEVFCPSNVVIYHMPFEQDDTMHFSSLVKRDIQRYGDKEGVQTHVLCHEKDTICF